MKSTCVVLRLLNSLHLFGYFDSHINYIVGYCQTVQTPSKQSGGA